MIGRTGADTGAVQIKKGCPWGNVLNRSALQVGTGGLGFETAPPALQCRQRISKEFLKFNFHVASVNVSGRDRSGLGNLPTEDR
jgi:hypothetical protein